MAFCVKIIRILLLFNIISAIYSNSSSSIEYTLDLLKKGDQIIRAGEYEDVILLLGNTGSGKSTLAQLLAGDNDKIISEEVTSGSGEYIIKDFNNRISNNSTLISQTIFPELIVDNITNNAYYDCTGFMDTRNSSIDIASSYFINKIISGAKRVKTVFVVNYSSVKEGVDRIDFLKLLSYASTLFQNFGKFQSGIAVVATKVDNIYVKSPNKELTLVPDEKVIFNIAQFLEKAKLSIKELILQEINPKKKTNYENSIELLDILLTKQNDKFIKIGIFRRPDEPGPISKIELLQKGKTELQNLIYTNIEYIDKKDHSFGYAISAESNAHITDILEEINNFVAKDLENVVIKINNDFINLENKLIDILETKESFSRAYDVIFNMVKSFDEQLTISQLVKKLEDNIKITLNVPMDEENLKFILRHNEFLTFVQLLTSNEFQFKSVALAQPFQMFLKYLSDSSAIYGFLQNLKVKLADWSVQEDTTKFDLNKLKLQITELQTQNILITGSTFQYFLEQIYHAELKDEKIIPGYDLIKSYEFNTAKVQTLLVLFDLAMTSTTQYFCENDNKLIAKGDYIKINEVLAKQSECPQKTEIIALFSTNKIFINQDLNMIGQKVAVNLIAPVIEVIDVRQINLIGDNAPSLPNPNAENGATAITGALQGANGGEGQIGLPGLGGFPGGSYFSISERIKNHGSLTIKSIGGNGSPGQIGGNGGNGENGKDVDWVIIETKKIWWIRVETCEQKGGLAGQGGNGGAGGKGGLPGVSSEINVMNLMEKALPQIENINGQPSQDGGGGSRGVGGASGNQCTGIRAIKNKGTEWRDVKCNRINAPNGVDGVPGQNSNGLASPAPLVIDKKIVINDYLQFLSTKLYQPVTNRELLQFWNNLKNNPIMQ